MLFQRPGQPVSYTMGLFQTADREMAKSKMGEEEACLNKKQKKKIQVGRCDITCHLSPVTCHLSPVTGHMSHVTCHLSPDQLYGSGVPF